MINHYKYKTKNGLKVTYVYKPNFSKCYAGIGVKYGGCNLSYTADGIEYKDHPGVAHFLEHRLFDYYKGNVMDLYDELGAYTNAFTSA